MEKILVIEDDEVMSSLIIEILTKEGEKFKAILLGAEDNNIKFAREIKTKGKKSKTFKTGEEETISLDDVKYVKEIITF